MGRYFIRMVTRDKNTQYQTTRCHLLLRNLSLLLVCDRNCKYIAFLLLFFFFGFGVLDGVRGEFIDDVSETAVGLILTGLKQE